MRYLVLPTCFFFFSICHFCYLGTTFRMRHTLYRNKTTQDNQLTMLFCFAEVWIGLEIILNLNQSASLFLEKCQQAKHPKKQHHYSIKYLLHVFRYYKLYLKQFHGSFMTTTLGFDLHFPVTWKASVLLPLAPSHATLLFDIMHSSRKIMCPLGHILQS